jgi:hypothetical protein
MRPGGTHTATASISYLEQNLGIEAALNGEPVAHQTQALGIAVGDRHGADGWVRPQGGQEGARLRFTADDARGRRRFPTRSSLWSIRSMLRKNVHARRSASRASRIGHLMAPGPRGNTGIADPSSGRLAPTRCYRVRCRRATHGVTSGSPSGTNSSRGENHLTLGPFGWILASHRPILRWRRT